MNRMCNSPQAATTKVMRRMDVIRSLTPLGRNVLTDLPRDRSGELSRLEHVYHMASGVSFSGDCMSKQYLE